jgi:hypothetical protein
LGHAKVMLQAAPTRRFPDFLAQNPLPPPPPLPPPLEPPPPDPDELGLDDMLLAAAWDIVLIECEKLDASNIPPWPVYHVGGSR